MASPFPFTSGQVLTAAQLNSISDAVAFTPTWTAGLTVGNATENWYYYEINDLVVITGATVFGSTTALSANPAMTLPVTAASDALNTSIGKGSSHDAGTAQYPNFWILTSTTSVTCFHMAAGGSYVTTGSANATTPFTWTTNDKIGGNIIYRRA